MTPTSLHQPVILLLGKRGTKQDEVDTWLEESRYLTSEATDVFQALEQISDFTMGETPDVVFLHVDRLEAELEMLQGMLLASGADFHASVLTYSDRDSQRSASRDASGLVALASQLERLIPSGPQVN